MPLSEEVKTLIDENQQIVQEIRTKNEEFEKQMYTKVEFQEFEEKIDAQFLANKDLIEKLETEIKRPEAPDDEKAEKARFHKKAFLNYIRCTARGEQMDAEEQKALVADTTGRILLPEDLEAEIYLATPTVTIMRNLVLVRQTTLDRVRSRSMTEVTVGWGKLELGAEPDETDTTPSETTHYVEDLEGLARIGKDELADSDVSLEQIIIDSFTRAMGVAEDTAIVNGTGHSYEQPTGITNGTTVTRVSTASADAIVANDMLDLRQDIPSQYRANAVFVMHSSTELALMKLIDSYGQFLWQPQVSLDIPATWAGKKVYTQDDLPEVGDSAQCDLVIGGDLRAGYRLIDRTGITIQIMREVWATAGLVGILVSKRVGGGIIRDDAMRILQET